MHKIPYILLAAVAGTALLGCRGGISTSPPIHLVPNMDFQDKLKAQSESDFPGWTDKRGMRLPVKGTVARGSLGKLSQDPAVRTLHTGKDDSGKFVSNPVKATLANIKRGRQRYDIHCAVCHALNGRGMGIVGRLLAPQVPPCFVKQASDDVEGTRHDPRVKTLPDGELFEIITNGKATMQQYGTQIDVHDRWCIVHYIRALQHRALH